MSGSVESARPAIALVKDQVLPVWSLAPSDSLLGREMSMMLLYDLGKAESNLGNQSRLKREGVAE